MQTLLNAEANNAQGISFFDRTPILRVTRSLDEIRPHLVVAMLRLEIARLDAAIGEYDPAEDIAGMMPDLISSDDDEFYY